ncbi:hypothetical protein JD844_004183 [Phrynosoma platyrhinos]|uniref:Malignant T-cell-amplified sequence n=1 Tax=Phrynosoma platyrhinos TaxID=52577 RepID=A0ABQ7TMS4_PHRPL|nr:hypothetical protein JD844_004183 [Phrynosoma platyrhinos]
MAKPNYAKERPGQDSTMEKICLVPSLKRKTTSKSPTKKLIIFVYSSHEHIEILTVNGELLFFRQREGPFYPTLRLLHKWMRFSFSFHFDDKVHLLMFEDEKCCKVQSESYLLCLLFFPFLDPFILPHQQVDKGAIKFVLSGANIMCPGLTSPGAKLYPAAADTIVAIMAEGKQHALCVGVMKMSADDIEKVNKGIGIENIHYLNDGLWHMKTYK